MGLFQKKEYANTELLYSLSANKTVLVIGLGNPEKSYDGTRHNIGFAAVDHFAQQNDFPGWVDKKDLKCHLCIHKVGDARIILCKPMTYMNNSGEAAQAAQHFYRIYNKNTLVVYDELAIPFGQIRTRVGGSDAGHNGVKSLIQHLGDDFGRLRMGLGNKSSEKTESSDFVLGKFTKEEQGKLPLIMREAQALITEFIFSGQLPHETRNLL